MLRFAMVLFLAAKQPQLNTFRAVRRRLAGSPVANGTVDRRVPWLQGFNEV